MYLLQDLLDELHKFGMGYKICTDDYSCSIVYRIRFLRISLLFPLVKDLQSTSENVGSFPNIALLVLTLSELHGIDFVDKRNYWLTLPSSLISMNIHLFIGFMCKYLSSVDLLVFYLTLFRAGNTISFPCTADYSGVAVYSYFNFAFPPPPPSLSIHQCYL